MGAGPGRLARDTALAVALLGVFLSPVWAPVGRCPCPLGPPAAALAAVAVLPVAFRRRAPLTVLAVLSVAYPFWPILDLPASPLQSLPALLAAWTVATHSAHPRRVRALVLLTPALILLVAVSGVTDLDSLDAVYFATVFVGAWAVAEALRDRREYAAALEAAQVELARHAAEAERSRLARELHDVVGHAMSVITVQAGVGAHLARDDPDRALAALATIEEVGRRALEDLRSMVGAMRDEDGSPAPLAPLAGADRLPDLVADVAASGVEVDLVVEGAAVALPPSHDLAVYRVVQEALTNVVRHAGPTRARVVLRYDGDAVTVEVRDAGRTDGARVARPDRGGHGLQGLEERLALLGGRLDAGPTPEGGFRVRARVPAPAAATST